MPAPITPILDDFNRADGSVGSNWSVFGGTGGVVSNQLVSSGGLEIEWQPALFGPDLELYVDVVTSIGGFGGIWFTTATGESGDGYAFFHSIFTGDAVIYRVDAGVETQLGTRPAAFIADGDSVMVKRSGSSIEIWRQRSGSWTSQMSRTDGTHGYSTYIATIYPDDSGTVVDNFGGGTIVAKSFRVQNIRPRMFAPGIAR